MKRIIFSSVLLLGLLIWAKEEVNPQILSNNIELSHRIKRGEEEVYIDIAVEKVKVNKWEYERGSKVAFYVIIWNRGEFSEHTLILRVLSRNRTLADKLIRIDDWDVNDRKEVILTWDTNNSIPGEYPITIEASLNEDVDDFDNELPLKRPIIIR
jgi:hypothetical protein